MLGNNAFYLGIAEGFDGPVAVIPAGNTAGGISPNHVYLGAAFFFGSQKVVVQPSPIPTETTEAPLITKEIVIIAAVVLVAVVCIVAFWALRKRR